MRGVRHPASSLGTGVLAVVLIAILASGCGSSGTESSGEGTTAPPGVVVPVCAAAPAGVEALRVSGVNCAKGHEIVVAWTKKHACATPAGTSRTSCTVGAYRCLAAAAEHGLMVSCARPDRSISFISKRS